MSSVQITGRSRERTMSCLLCRLLAVQGRKLFRFFCADYWPFKGENWGVLASVLGAGAILIVTAACCRRLKKSRDPFDELYDLNEGPYVHKYGACVATYVHRCTKR